MRTGKLRKPFTLFLSFVVALTVLGCSDDETPTPKGETPTLSVDVTPSVTEGDAPLEVDFDATATLLGSNETVEFTWSFQDDSGGSNEEDPTHTFESAGTYDVTVDVTAGDLTASASTTITVTRDTDPSIVAATASPELGLAPLVVELECEAEGGEAPVNYYWDFGDGTASSIPSVPHTYASEGEYRATCTVTDADGDSDSAEVIIQIGEDTRPIPTISASPSSGSPALDVEFAADVVGGNGALTYAWDFGDETTSTEEAPTHTFSAPGDYTVRLVVTDENGDLGVATTTVTVIDSFPSVDFVATPTVGTSPLDVVFNATADGGDGTLTYAWIFGDGGTSTDEDPTHTYTASGVYAAELTVTDEDGDVARATTVIQVEVPNTAPVVDATVDTTCTQSGKTITFDASGTTDPDGDLLDYDWRFIRLPSGSQASLNDTSILNPSFEADVPGTYEARVFVSDGTDTVASSTLTVTADDTVSTLVKTSSDPADTEAGAQIADPLSVRAQNGCGANLEGAVVEWTTTNASVDRRTTQTLADGTTTTNASAGTLADAASVTASSGNGSATFNFDVLPGPPAQLTMVAPATATVSDTTGAQVEFRVEDQYGNLSTTAIDFTASIVSGPPGATLGAPNGRQTVDVSTTTGTATVDVFSTIAGPVVIDTINATPQLQSIAMRSILLDDFESSNPNWFQPFGTEWEIGAPTSGPGSALSGSNVLATNLDGNYSGTATSHLMVREFAIEGPQPLAAILRFSHWFDMVSMRNTCSTVTGFAAMMGIPLTPEGGFFEVQPCSQPEGFAGASNGWVESVFVLPFVEPRLFLEFFFEVQATVSNPQAGWYIDDIWLDLFFRTATINFEAGPAAAVAITNTTDGASSMMCSVAATASAALTDEFGNRTDGSLDWALTNATGNPAVVGATVGSLETPPGPTGTASSIDGRLTLEVVSDVAESIDLSLTLAGAAAPATATLTFGAPPPIEVSCSDGRDEDCDGFTDCADTDCSATPACIGATCSTAVNLIYDGIETHTWLGDSCMFGYDDSVRDCPTPPGGNDAFFTFQANVTGDHQICVDGPFPQFSAELFDTSTGCSRPQPLGPGICSLPGGACVRVPLTAGSTYTGSIYWPDCGPGTTITVREPAQAGCQSHCDCNPEESCVNGRCEPADPAMCTETCDGDLFCNVIGFPMCDPILGCM